jgi:flagellin-specific chaperone FliS
MNPYQKYRRQTEAVPRTRIDSLLALYDKALERLDKAEAALRANNKSGAVPHLAKAQLIVVALAAGVRLEVSPDLNMTVLRLYEFAVRNLQKPSLEGIDTAREALRTLRNGFERIRCEANELEHTGQIPALDRLQMVHATA